MLKNVQVEFEVLRITTFLGKGPVNYLLFFPFLSRLNSLVSASSIVTQQKMSFTFRQSLGQEYEWDTLSMWTQWKSSNSVSEYCQQWLHGVCKSLWGWGVFYYLQETFCINSLTFINAWQTYGYNHSFDWFTIYSGEKIWCSMLQLLPRAYTFISFFSPDSFIIFYAGYCWSTWKSFCWIWGRLAEGSKCWYLHVICSCN